MAARSHVFLHSPNTGVGLASAIQHTHHTSETKHTTQNVMHIRDITYFLRLPVNAPHMRDSILKQAILQFRDLTHCSRLPSTHHPL